MKGLLARTAWERVERVRPASWEQEPQTSRFPSTLEHRFLVLDLGEPHHWDGWSWDPELQDVGQGARQSGTSTLKFPSRKPHR